MSNKERREMGSSGGGGILKGLFEDRLMANMRIRSSLEKVIEDQKNEEVVYKEYIQQVQEKPSLGFLGKHPEISGSKNERFGSDQISLLQNRITELEEKFHQEFEKRVKLQKAFLNFKTEGNSIIDRLRFALRQVGTKYRKERMKNRHLTRRLNEQLLNQTEIGEEEKFRKLKQLLRASSNELQKYKVQFNRVEGKFVSYKRMVVDHKKVIVALRKKLERYQEENENFRKQASSTHRPSPPGQVVPASPPMVGRPTQKELSPMVRPKEEEEKEDGSEEEESESSEDEEEDEDDDDEDEDDEDEEEDIQMKSRLRKFGVEESGDEEDDSSEDEGKKSAKDVVKDQKHLIKKLLDRLESEEGQRLKTEEQSYKIVEEEERTISFLESQIKNLTNNSLLRDGDEDGEGLEGMSPMKEID